jgi:AcrR family transcriptional regulator
MPRPQLHDPETMLDAARELVLELGPRGATMEAIAVASGAPTGSLYHRFDSRDALLARLWMRAAYRSQASYVAALEEEDPLEAGVLAALALFDFCREHPRDAGLLAAIRREDLVGDGLGADLEAEAAAINTPIERAVGSLARRLYGRRNRTAVERIRLATMDLPFGAARRHLRRGGGPPAALRPDVERAVRATLDAPLPEHR